MSSLQKHLQKSKLPPVSPSSNAGGGRLGRKNIGRKRDYTPVSWEKYFDSQIDVKVSQGNIFKVYRAGEYGPLLVLLHGGGYSGLTWALLTANLLKLVECQVVAIDLRGHGSSKTTDDGDLSAETMSSDVGEILSKMFGEEQSAVILVGHSMGGAIAVHTAYRKLVPALVGLVVIDVVEGGNDELVCTAMDALQSMQSFLRGRPSSFKSIENAIEWCVRTGQVRNLDSVKVSMPGQIRNIVTGNIGTEDLAVRSDGDGIPATGDDSHSSLHRDSSIPEEEEEEEEEAAAEEEENMTAGAECSEKSPKKSKVEDGLFKIPSVSPLVERMNYVWRIDLSKTEEYWTGWFQGLSNMFLDCVAAKMLLLAGIDRLDKDLTIGQMQGKFQMQVLPQCGHAVHEDVPDKVAEVLASFLVRNKFAQPVDNFQACVY